MTSYEHAPSPMIAPRTNKCSRMMALHGKHQFVPLVNQRLSFYYGWFVAFEIISFMGANTTTRFMNQGTALKRSLDTH